MPGNDTSHISQNSSALVDATSQSPHCIVLHRPSQGEQVVLKAYYLVAFEIVGLALILPVESLRLPKRYIVSLLPRRITRPRTQIRHLFSYTSFRLGKMHALTLITVLLSFLGSSVDGAKSSCMHLANYIRHRPDKPCKTKQWISRQL